MRCHGEASHTGPRSGEEETPWGKKKEKERRLVRMDSWTGGVLLLLLRRLVACETHAVEILRFAVWQNKGDARRKKRNQGGLAERNRGNDKFGLWEPGIVRGVQRDRNSFPGRGRPG